MPFTIVQFKKFAQYAVTTSQATIYTVPASSQDVIKGIDISNTTSSPIDISVDLVPSGGSVIAGTKLFTLATIPAHTTLHWTGTQVLNTGDFISCVASATGLTINISGLEST